MKESTREALIVWTVIAFVAALLVLVLFSASHGGARVPCAIDGKPCTPRRECVINCQQCQDNDNCCCKHVDKCSCIEPETGRRCCDGD